MGATAIVAADLGQNVSAFTCRINGTPTAVVNTAAASDPTIYRQAVLALKLAGIDAEMILGALHGVHR